MTYPIRDPFNGGVRYHCPHCNSSYEKRYEAPMVEHDYDDLSPDALRAFENWVASHGYNCDNFQHSKYTDLGFASRQEYLEDLAETYGHPIENVMALAELLGPEEDFDGLVSELGD